MVFCEENMSFKFFIFCSYTILLAWFELICPLISFISIWRHLRVFVNSCWYAWFLKRFFSKLQIIFDNYFWKNVSAFKFSQKSNLIYCNNLLLSCVLMLPCLEFVTQFRFWAFFIFFFQKQCNKYSQKYKIKLLLLM